ncbi:MAG TPA: 5-oxoprolinase subunit PxpB [Paracoccaceae bacterium]
MTRYQPAHSIADQPRISLMGTHALLFEAPGAFDLAHQSRIWALADLAAGWPGVREAVPGMTNLTLLFDTPPDDIPALTGALSQAWDSGMELPIEGRILDLPITYGGEGGPHLRDVAAATGLSIDEVVELHTAPLYTVYAVGSHAGYCYLGGLDPRLFLPRRAVPLLSIPGGSLSVAGMQTGVSASAGPSGWHTIGRADIAFFDPLRRPPSLLQPGDRIRFRAETVIR